MTPTLTCAASDQCSLSAVNGDMIAKRTGFMKTSYQLKCAGARRFASKTRVYCNRATGEVKSRAFPNYETFCQNDVLPEKYYCDFNTGDDASSGSLDGAVYIASTDSGVSFTGSISSADEVWDAGYHGFHVHANASPLNNEAGQCKGAGGHFGLPGQIHGAPTDSYPDRHVGDIANIFATDSDGIRTAPVDVDDAKVSLNPASVLFIGNKSIVVHANIDDHNPTDDPTSTGAAGSRPGCCTIKPVRYTCDFVGAGADLTGQITFKYEGDQVRVTGTISAPSGFADGQHGFHVHANAATSNSCSDAGGHFKWSDDEIHGASTETPPNRHAGDLGNIDVVGGVAEVNILDHVVSLIPGEDYFIGDRAIVVHMMHDDANPTNDPSSTGAAGARLGCCILNKA